MTWHHARQQQSDMLVRRDPNPASFVAAADAGLNQHGRRETLAAQMHSSQTYVNLLHAGIKDTVEKTGLQQEQAKL